MGLTGGIRVLDTAVNYRAGRSEAVLGRCLAEAVTTGLVRRCDVTVATKIGYVRPPTGPKQAPTGPERHGDLDHCFAPACLQYALELSQESLGVGRIDVCYLHNPEEQLRHGSAAGFARTMLAAFEVMESAVDHGIIGCYGIATWAGARGSSLPLAQLKSLARSAAGGDDHLLFIQAPLSLSRQVALAPAHAARAGYERVSLTSLCHQLGIRLVVSAATGGTPGPSVAPTYGPIVLASIRWVLSLPDLDRVLVGTLRPQHLQQILDAAANP